MLLYKLKAWTVREENVKYAGLCKGFTNFLFKKATSSDRALYLVVHDDQEQNDKGRKWKG